MKDAEEQLRIIRKIVNKPESSQRQMAVELGFSLGKLNYCLNELKKKVLLKLIISKKVKKNLVTSIHLLLQVLR